MLQDEIVCFLFTYAVQFSFTVITLNAAQVISLSQRVNTRMNTNIHDKLGFGGEEA